MITINPLLKTDSYKVSHPHLFKGGTNYMQEHFESRTNNLNFVKWFGLQYPIKQHLLERITPSHVMDAEGFFEGHFGTDKIFAQKAFMEVAINNQGRWPVNIWAKEEGKYYSGGTPLMIVEPVKPSLENFWMAAYLEGVLSQTWYPTSVATNSAFMKKMLKKFLEETSDMKPGTAEFDNTLNFMLHDFGFRGVSGIEEAGLGGMAHLLNFLGTDTLPGIVYGQKTYNTTAMLGFSIAASEHSTYTSWGGPLGEAAAMANMLDKFPTGIIAGVSDSYDVNNAIRNIWGGQLKKLVLGRDGRLVIRLDSGDPVMSTRKNFEAAWETFGGIINSKGNRVLNPKVRLIQGDGIDANMLLKILESLKAAKISTENFAFGSGGGLLRKFDRDTHKFAMKCNMVVTNHEEVDVFKRPMEWNEQGIYQVSFKESKRGDLLKADQAGENPMKLIYSNGELLHEYRFEDLRELTT